MAIYIHSRSSYTRQNPTSLAKRLEKYFSASDCHTCIVVNCPTITCIIMVSYFGAPSLVLGTRLACWQLQLLGLPAGATWYS